MKVADQEVLDFAIIVKDSIERSALIGPLVLEGAMVEHAFEDSCDADARVIVILERLLRGDALKKWTFAIGSCCWCSLQVALEEYTFAIIDMLLCRWA